MKHLNTSGPHSPWRTPISRLQQGKPFSNNVFATKHVRDGTKRLAHRNGETPTKKRCEIQFTGYWSASTMTLTAMIVLKMSVYFFLLSNTRPKATGGLQRVRSFLLSHCLRLFIKGYYLWALLMGNKALNSATVVVKKKLRR